MLGDDHLVDTNKVSRNTSGKLVDLIITKGYIIATRFSYSSNRLN